MNKQNQEEIIQQLEEHLRAVRDRKGSDYANEDVLSNFKVAGASCGLTAEQNALSLIATKVARLGNLLQKDKEVKNEPIKDSVIDLINYGYLLYCLLEEDSVNVSNKETPKDIGKSSPRMGIALC